MLKSVGFEDADTVQGAEYLKRKISEESTLAFESTQDHFENLILPFDVYEWAFNDSLTFRWSAVTPLRLGLRLMGGRMFLSHEKSVRLASFYTWVDFKDTGAAFGLGLESVLNAFNNVYDLKIGVLNPVFVPPFWEMGVPYFTDFKMPVVYSESLELRQITFKYKEDMSELLNIPNNWTPNGAANEIVAHYIVGFPASDKPLKVLDISDSEPYPAIINVDTDGFVNLMGKIERSRLFANPVNGESFWRLRILVDLTPVDGPEVNPVTGLTNYYRAFFECVIPNRGYDLAVSANKDMFVEITGLVFAGVFSPMGTTSVELFEKQPAM